MQHITCLKAQKIWKTINYFWKVPLGVLPKNENLNGDMIDIMETIQEKYIPKVKEESGLKTVFFGGDQLTEERARNVQKARSDGRTKAERLEGLWAKNEDWHAIRIAYEVGIKLIWFYLMNQTIYYGKNLRVRTTILRTC